MLSQEGSIGVDPSLVSEDERVVWHRDRMDKMSGNGTRPNMEWQPTAFLQSKHKHPMEHSMFFSGTINIVSWTEQKWTNPSRMPNIKHSATVVCIVEMHSTRRIHHWLFMITKWVVNTWWPATMTAKTMENGCSYSNLRIWPKSSVSLFFVVAEFYHNHNFWMTGLHNERLHDADDKAKL